MLWTALALGADKAIYVNTKLRHDTELQPFIVAQILKYLAEREKSDLVLLGKQCNHWIMQLLMTIATRQDSCWLACSIGHKQPSPPRSSPEMEALR